MLYTQTTIPDVYTIFLSFFPFRMSFTLSLVLNHAYLCGTASCWVVTGAFFLTSCDLDSREFDIAAASFTTKHVVISSTRCSCSNYIFK